MERKNIEQQQNLHENKLTNEDRAVCGIKY